MKRNIRVDKYLMLRILYLCIDPGCDYREIITDPEIREYILSHRDIKILIGLLVDHGYLYEDEIQSPEYRKCVEEKSKDKRVKDPEKHCRQKYPSTYIFKTDPVKYSETVREIMRTDNIVEACLGDRCYSVK